MKLLFRLRPVFIAAAALAAAGCAAAGGPPPVAAPYNTQNAAATAQTRTITQSQNNTGDYKPLSIIYETENNAAAKYEPEAGCYKGADITASKVYNDISGFESYTGVSHAIYACSMTLGGDYPLTFILECISAGKTPCVTINPPDAPGADIYSVDTLKKTADDFASVKTPLFIIFYPYSSSLNYNAGAYTAFFRMAAEIFAERAPFAVLVWSVDSGDVFNCGDYYPGDANADWAGLDINAGFIGASGYDPDLQKEIEYFYFKYQKQKPIMFSLKISHYATSDNTYRNEDAAGLMTRLFGDIKNKYVRVKAYIYRDESLPAAGGDDYSIDSGDMRDAYKSAVGGASFLSTVSETAGAFYQKSRFLSAHSAYMDDTGVFIPASSLISDLGFAVADIGSMGDPVSINFEDCYPSYEAERVFSLYTEIDYANGILYIYK